MSDIFILKNHALPAASELTSAGSAVIASLTSSTSPEIGAKTSDAAFTEFDHRRGVGLLQAAPDLGQLDEHDIAELRLRVIGDPDGGDIALDAEPFMV